MSGLDPIGRAEIINLIQDLKKQGKSILFCSHILEDVEQEKSSSLVDAYLSIIQKEGTDV
jgi:ABC-2 type transport system ATP-binding protein